MGESAKPSTSLGDDDGEELEEQEDALSVADDDFTDVNVAEENTPESPNPNPNPNEAMWLIPELKALRLKYWTLGGRDRGKSMKDIDYRCTYSGRFTVVV